MRRYETIYILRPSLNEEQINTVVEKAQETVTSNNGKIIELDRWGMKKLAYQIKKESQGFYIFCDYSATPEAVTEMERRFRIDDAVLRYMTVKTADVITEEEIIEATARIADKQVVEEEVEEPGAGDEESAKPAPTTSEKSEVDQKTEEA
ncbi:MAG TPA: 30S ribosomal protein S6 [Desulfopila sp.]|nr:30S ribosomal protein S6 [Desulfopila sp.]